MKIGQKIHILYLSPLGNSHVQRIKQKQKQILRRVNHTYNSEEVKIELEIEVAYILRPGKLVREVDHRFSVLEISTLERCEGVTWGQRN